MENQPKPQVNTGLISLEIVSKMNNVDIDMRSIVREYGISTANIEPEELMKLLTNIFVPATEEYHDLHSDI